MDNKPWYQSTGVVGALVALSALAGNSIGHVVISADDVNAALDLLAREMELIGTVMALIGRIKATRTIGARDAPPPPIGFTKPNLQLAVVGQARPTAIKSTVVV